MDRIERREWNVSVTCVYVIDLHNGTDSKMCHSTCCNHVILSNSMEHSP